MSLDSESPVATHTEKFCSYGSSCLRTSHRLPNQSCLTFDPQFICSYPILECRPASATPSRFVYQSRTACQHSSGPDAEVPTMGGYFRFVEDTLENPGEFFNVTVGTIHFDRDIGFIY